MIQKEKIVSFILKVLKNKGYTYIKNEMYRTAIIYYSVVILQSIGCEEELEELKSEFINYILQCKNKDGGFGAAENYPSHIFSTFIALQTLYSLNYNYYDIKTIEYLKMFKCKYGDEFCEEDNRFTIATLCSLFFLFKWKNTDMEFLCFLKNHGFDINSILLFILNCYNKDGGFGAFKGAESHLGQIYCCISSLNLLNLLENIDKRKVIKFILLRQQESGGFNGRPYKKEDSCYSYYALASLKSLNSHHLIDKEKLINFIFSCQNEDGGFTDRPGNPSDPYHTCYALLALSILGYFNIKPSNHIAGVILKI